MTPGTASTLPSTEFIPSEVEGLRIKLRVTICATKCFLKKIPNSF
jgi:hypothetical protein